MDGSLAGPAADQPLREGPRSGTGVPATEIDTSPLPGDLVEGQVASQADGEALATTPAGISGADCADGAHGTDGMGGTGGMEGPIDLPLDGTDTAAASDIRSEPGDMPSFVREAERAARWRQPRVRAALALACAAAALSVAGQWMLAQRDLIAARSPALKPLLTTACSAIGCEVRAPRSLEALRVESSGLVRVEKSDLYRLTVALRNLRAHEVALPALELVLTDTQGQLIARRVLRAAEVGARVGALATGGELTLQATLQVGGGTVAGYTIELFYP